VYRYLCVNFYVTHTNECIGICVWIFCGCECERRCECECADDSCNVNESCHTYERVMSRVRTSHVTHVNESCHTYRRVMSFVRTSHVTHRNEACHTYERVMLHGWMSLVTRTNKANHKAPNIGNFSTLRSSQKYMPKSIVYHPYEI